MKPQRFEIGQSVTHKMKPPYYPEPGADIPKLGEVYTIDEVRPIGPSWYYGLAELNSMTHENWLDPIDMSDSEIRALLEETQTVEI